MAKYHTSAAQDKFVFWSCKIVHKHITQKSISLASKAVGHADLVVRVFPSNLHRRESGTCKFKIKNQNESAFIKVDAKTSSRGKTGNNFFKMIEVV